MSQEAVRVLLLGETARASSHLLWHLEQRGCYCWIASSADQSIALYKKHRFPLILSTNPMRQATQMISLLGRSNCTVFYAYPVENGCWWLPLMKDGQKCLGAPALRPSEFTGVKGRVKLDHWGGGKLDQMSVWEIGISTEGGV